MKERPEELPSETTRIKTGLGNLYVTITENDGKPFEIFLILGKNGGGLQAKAEAIGRLSSLALRNGIPLEEIIDQLAGIMDDQPFYNKKQLIGSIPDAVAIVLKKYAEKKKYTEKK